jgi:hypothetical protein
MNVTQKLGPRFREDDECVEKGMDGFERIFITEIKCLMLRQSTCGEVLNVLSPNPSFPT